MSNTQYFNEFGTFVDQLKNDGGKAIMWSKELIMIIKNVTAVSGKDEQEDKHRFLAVIFILGSDVNCFSVLTKDLLCDDIQGSDKYSTTIANAY